MTLIPLTRHCLRVKPNLDFVPWHRNIVKAVCSIFLGTACGAVLAQANDTSYQFELDASIKYEPTRVGGFGGAMRICLMSSRTNRYNNAYQAATQIMNQMPAGDRNQAMGSYQYVFRTRTFNGHSLSAAECDRIIRSDWVAFLNQVS